MSNETLPILLVVQSEPPSAAPGWATDLAFVRLAAIALAAKLGWLPIFPPSTFDYLAGDFVRVPGQTPLGLNEAQRAIVEETILQVADAVLVVGDHKANDPFHPGVQRLLERVATMGLPVYGTRPTTHGYPQRRQLTEPPFFGEWTKAATRIRLSIHNAHTDTWHQQGDSWACATCKRYFGGGDHGERLARWCCVKQQPCDACGALTDKTWTHCAACREKNDRERYAKRERRPAGDAMVYSDRDDEWFSDLDAAEERAAETVEESCDDLAAGEAGGVKETAEARAAARAGRVRAELEDMRLLTSEPVFACEFDLGNHVADELPDEGETSFDDLYSHVKDEVDALNAKLKTANPLSHTATNYAVDLDVVLPLTPEQAEAAYTAAVPALLSEERIAEIVAHATGAEPPRAPGAL